MFRLGKFCSENICRAKSKPRPALLLLKATPTNPTVQSAKAQKGNCKPKISFPNHTNELNGEIYGGIIDKQRNQFDII